MSPYYFDQESLAEAAAEAVEQEGAAAGLKDLGFVVFFLPTELTRGETALNLRNDSRPPLGRRAR